MRTKKQLRFSVLERTEIVKIYFKKYTFWHSRKQAEILYQNVYMTAFGIYRRKCGHFGINHGDGFHFIRIKENRVEK